MALGLSKWRDARFFTIYFYYFVVATISLGTYTASNWVRIGKDYSEEKLCLIIIGKDI